MVGLEDEVVDINDVDTNDVELLVTGNVILADTTDVMGVYTDVTIGNATGITSLDTDAVAVMTEDDAVVNDVVDDSDIVADVVRPPVANIQPL